MASGHVNRTKGRTHGCTDQCCKRGQSPCQFGAVHTWHFVSVARRAYAAIEGGDLNRSTQHLPILPDEEVAHGRTDLVHAEAEG